MRDTCGDPGVEFKESNRFESFRPGSCPEPKVLLNGAINAKLAASFRSKSIEGDDGINTGRLWILWKQIHDLVFTNLKIRWMC